MAEAILDAVQDTLKLIPFLFITYTVMEWLEQRSSEQTEKWIRRSGRLGPFFGAAAGLIPQCGLSAAASNLYAARLVTRGTLIAVFLSTSDEMLPLLLSSSVALSEIARLLGIKFISGITIGFIIDAADRHFHSDRFTGQAHIHELCEQEHCSCEDGIIKSALRHTAQIGVFLLAACIFLNLAIFFLGEDRLLLLTQSRPALSVFLSALAGLIPNCAPSVMITELYLQGALSLGAAMSGLLTGTGVGVLVLFRMNHNLRENLQLALLLFLSGLCVGLLLTFL